MQKVVKNAFDVPRLIVENCKKGEYMTVNLSLIVGHILGENVWGWVNLAIFSLANWEQVSVPEL